MREIDLHVHTTASDGTCTPRETVRLASEKGLRALAITDHDTVFGHAEAVSAGMDCGVEVVPGIEVSTRYGVSVHILGYYIENLIPLLENVVNDRDRRNEQVAALMAADGLPVDYAEMKKRFGRVIGRPHFGRILVEQGLAESVSDAFARYLGRGQRYFIPRRTLEIDEAVEAVVLSGGVPVLAHPFQYKKDDRELRELISVCMDHGLRGMECRYSGYDADQVRYLESLAEEYGLLKTGGSDFHGDNKPHISLGTGINGELDVPYAWLESLREEAEKHHCSRKSQAASSPAV
ncbi:MAG: PHP domain-containing protein [Oscillospiraceae bacterium]|nr:PHP domain-containing protein [Oscillospiraceae bacterium]